MSCLSVVIVARNEEDHIAQCLHSVVLACAEIEGTEIVMVDSASTDRTVEIASSLGIRILSLASNCALSASAGRFVGFQRTCGPLVMFVDGDTVIDHEWFHAAIPCFKQSDVAGVMGYLRDVDVEGNELPYVGRRSERVVTSPWLRGIAMYRRTAMTEAGTFNPHLREEEEAELAFRLRRQGWRLLSIPQKMGDHLRGARESDFLLSRARLPRYSTIGRTLCYSVRAGTGTKFLFERYRPTVFFVMFTSMLLAGAVFSFIGYRLVAEVTLISFASAVAAIAVKKRTVMGPLLYFVKHCLILWNLLIGFVTTRPKDPCDYPVDIVEVREASVTMPIKQHTRDPEASSLALSD